MMDEEFAPLDRSFWIQISAALLIAYGLYLLAGLLYSFAVLNFPGGTVPFRVRIESIASVGGSLAGAILVLSAVLALIQAARVSSDAGRLRPLFALAFAFSVAVLVLNLYSAWDVLTLKHTSRVGPLSSTLDDWNARLAALMPRIAAGVLAGCAMVLANRRAPLRVVESEPGEAFAE
jgi:hypothetical protein